MDCCRLCLENAELNSLDSESLGILENFLPHMSKYFNESPTLCDTCKDNTKSVKTLIKNVHETAAKIKIAMSESGLDTIELRSLHDNLSVLPANVSMCRLCLKDCNKARLFLYENNINILSHDLIKSMLSFCNINLNFELSERPVMCIDCWQLLQASYSFKKDYLEADRKIRLYCLVFKIRMRNLENEVLHKVNAYFNGETCPDLQPIKNERDLNELDGYFLRKPIKEEFNSTSNKRYIKKEFSPRIKNEYEHTDSIKPLPFAMMQHRRKRYTFTKEDDKFLVRMYFQNGNTYGVFRKLADKWNECRPGTPLRTVSIRQRVLGILNQQRSTGLSKTEIENIRCKVKEELKSEENTYVNMTPAFSKRIISADLNCTDIEKNTMPQLEAEGRSTPVQKDNERKFDMPYQNTPSRRDSLISNNLKELEHSPSADLSDSDDYFEDEVISAAPSSFTPHIKAEPLSDDDEEISIIEPSTFGRNVNEKPSTFGRNVNETDGQSDDDALPQLERMDLPPMEIKIQDFYSVDVKREELNMLTNESERGDSLLVVEDLNTCRRISLKNEDTSVFKCMQCSFETKYRFCASRHAKWHGRSRKKMYECQSCSYRISNKLDYAKHMRTHNENFSDDDIPVLYPYTMKY